MYSLEIKKQAKKYLEKMPIAYRDRIFLAFGAICLNQTKNLDITKLQGQHENLYRLRIGDYRVVYAVENGQYKIIMIELTSRGDAYKSL